MDWQGRDNTGRGFGSRGQQDSPGNPAGGAGRGWQGNSGRQRERRLRGNKGDIRRHVPSPSAAVALLRQLLLFWLRISNYVPLFDHEKRAIYHYDVDVRLGDLPIGAGAAAEVSQPDLSAVKAELFKCYAMQFPAQVVPYDGHRALRTPELLPEGDFEVVVQGGVFHVTLNLVKQLVPSFGREMHAGAKDLWDVMYSVPGCRRYIDAMTCIPSWPNEKF